MIRGLLLSGLGRYEDASLFLLRLGTGVFLVHGVWDNVSEPARMAEFAGFLRQFRFPAPELMAPVSVYAQLAVGLLFIGGLFTRWAGWLCVANFLVAIAMVDRLSPQGFRGMWPALALVLIGLHLGIRGAGRLSLDALLERRGDHSTGLQRRAS